MAALWFQKDIRLCLFETGIIRLLTVQSLPSGGVFINLYYDQKILVGISGIDIPI